MSYKQSGETYFLRLYSILMVTDLDKLDKSCNSLKQEYAKEVLKKLHNAFVETYGAIYLTSYAFDFIDVPAVVRSIQTGHIGIGLVSLDLSSSGEHYGTSFITPIGVINHGSGDLDEEQRNYMSNTYMTYEYWYTVDIEVDNHVNFNNVQPKVASLLSSCRD